MAYDFPASPTIGQVYGAYTWDGEKWLSTAVAPTGAVRYDLAQGLTANQMAQARSNIALTKKNYIINGGMQVSQENGVTAGSVSSYYAVDQFFVFFTLGGLTTVQAVGASPGGSTHRLRTFVSTPDTAMTGSKTAIITTRLEGLRVADLKAGSGSAKPVVLQFSVRAPAGTYSVGIRNTPNTRCYVGEYTIAAGEANTDVVKSIAFTLDTAGTWATDNTSGMEITWVLAAGSTNQTPAGVWTAGNFFASPNQFNFMGTINNDFWLGDVSLTEGSVAPPFQLPDYASELALCQRYYWKSVASAGGYAGAAANNFGALIKWPVTMRANPTVAVSGGTATNATGLVVNVANADVGRAYATVTAAQVWFWDNFTIIVNIRL